MFFRNQKEPKEQSLNEVELLQLCQDMEKRIIKKNNQINELKDEAKQFREIVEKIQEWHYFMPEDCSKLILDFPTYEDACQFSIKLKEILTKEGQSQ